MSLPPALLQATEGDASSAEARLELWGGYALSDPVFLLLLPLVLLALWRGRARARHAAGRAPLVPRALPRSLAQRLGWLPPALEGLALALAIVGLARPLRGEVEYSTTTEGIDIALLVDRSTSMTHTDLEPGTRRTRLDVVKEVVGEFAARRMTDREGAADSCGLIVFARYPELRCPFTLDVDALLGALAEVEFAEQQEGGTGVGIALAKAVAVLRESEARSRIAVLLTDGENNIDVIRPLEAAELAAEAGIKVYTIFAGRYASDPFGRLIEMERLDTSELERIAELSGGRFFRAEDKRRLEEVYAEIERLERTPREEQRFAEQFDLYLPWVAAAFAVWLLAWISHCTWARRLP